MPERPALAAWLAHAGRERIPLQGLSDHFVSEAIYLGDPDGHGIEIYADRPRESWEGQVERLTTLPLDVDDLLGELDDPETAPFDGLPAGTTVGHVHLRVADVPQSIAFYRDTLGFDLMATYGDQAAFLAAGGYHHHVGANTWQSLGAPPAPEGTARLLQATVILPEAARDELAGTSRGGGHTGRAARPRPVRKSAGVRRGLGGTASHAEVRPVASRNARTRSMSSAAAAAS